MQFEISQKRRKNYGQTNYNYFLLTQPVKAECKYYAEADVKNGKIVNKQEHYTCKEKENF